MRLNDIIDRVHAYHPGADIELIRRAYVFSANAHQGQVRKSGEPYFTHPLEVSALLADMRLDEHAICAGMLHDTVEDTETTVRDIEDLFGKLLPRPKRDVLAEEVEDTLVHPHDADG